MIILDIDPHRSQPIYRQIVEQIEAAVAEGRLQPGDDLWPGRQIAAHYAISYQTVQRALSLLAQSGTVARSVRRGTVVAPTRQRRGRRNMVALLNGWPMFGGQPNYTLAEMRMLQGAMAELSAGMQGMFSLPLPGRNNSVKRLAHWADAHPFDGALLFGPIPDVVPIWLAQHGYGVVRVDTEADKVPCACVVQDNAGAMAQVVGYLAELGHHRIAFLRGDESVPHYFLRRNAFEGECRRLGLDFDTDLDIVWQQRTVAEVTAQVLEARPSALVVSADILAARVVAELHRLGVSVPRDLSVIGYDDEPFSQTLQPLLTTVHVPFEDMGRQGVKLLMAQAEQPMLDQFTGPQRIVVPTTLVIRDSVSSLKTKS